MTVVQWLKSQGVSWVKKTNDNDEDHSSWTYWDGNPLSDDSGIVASSSVYKSSDGYVDVSIEIGEKTFMNRHTFDKSVTEALESMKEYLGTDEEDNEKWGY